ncbi:MAG: hypothetical protein DRK00_00615 [Thermoprotei archaeon]|nr:MAG: hypothetical protein DRK00_00615 [Thermoprotei archaeon]
MDSGVEGMSGLTKTESLIVAAYMSRNPPPKAKELASQLGVSVRTVYKALYKYRKLCRELGIEPLTVSRRRSARSISQLEEVVAEEVRRWLSEVLSGPSPSALLSELSALRRSIEKLNESIDKLIKLLEAPNVRNSEEDQLGLPSFVRDNPWLEVLRSKR